MRRRRLYGLFEKRGFRWHRLNNEALSLERARVVWQSELLAPALGQPHKGVRSLRPVSIGGYEPKPPAISDGGKLLNDIDIAEDRGTISNVDAAVMRYRVQTALGVR